MIINLNFELKNIYRHGAPQIPIKPADMPSTLGLRIEYVWVFNNIFSQDQLIIANIIVDRIQNQEGHLNISDMIFGDIIFLK